MNFRSFQRFLKRIFRFADNYILRFVAPFGAGIATLLALGLEIDLDKLHASYPDWRGAVEFVGSFDYLKFVFYALIASFIGSIYNVWRTGDIRRLEDENIRLKNDNGAIAENILSLFEMVLHSLAVKLNLNEAGTERVSIYVHRSHDNSFVPFGRYSHNPQLKEKGRTRFPDSQGCIAKAWQEGWYFSRDFPEDRMGNAYVDFMLQRYNIPRNATRKMKMKPLSICAKRINVDTRPIAVIVIKSTRKDVLAEESLRSALSLLAEEYGRMIAAVDSYIPDPQKAQELGL